MSDAWPWLTLGALGAYHGLNPAMGWLFAVALGLQEQSRKALLQALAPLALGHAAAIGLVVVLASLVQLVAAPQILRVVGGAALVLFGLYKFVKPRSHPRWVGFRVSLPELAVWSFLMSSAHGAGLMLFPVLLGLSAHAEGLHTHGDTLAPSPLAGEGLTGGVSAFPLQQDLAAVTLHTVAMLAVMGTVALVVYEKLGVGFLRKAWLNLDVLWAVAIGSAGLVTLFT